MATGALDAVTKEMVYLAVSVTNGCALPATAQA
jgi:AhpD family alkylhydroperoxidase